MTSCAYVVIYLPVNRWTIYVHKAWDHFLLLVSGQSRASEQYPEPCYKFELVKVEFYYRHTECNEYKVYIKDGYKYKLIKDEIIPINQKDNYPKKRQ